MKRVLSVAVIVFIICITIVCSNAWEDQKTMNISVKAKGNTTVFELNSSRAAKDLYAQLPLSITVKNYGSNEKIFYPPKKLETADTPLADARAGTLAYYAPWGDVVMFYDSFGSAAGLYELGQAVSGSEYIQEMTGTIYVEKAILQEQLEKKERRKYEK